MPDTRIGASRLAAGAYLAHWLRDQTSNKKFASEFGRHKCTFQFCIGVTMHHKLGIGSFDARSTQDIQSDWNLACQKFKID